MIFLLKKAPNLVRDENASQENRNSKKTGSTKDTVGRPLWRIQEDWHRSEDIRSHFVYCCSWRKGLWVTWSSFSGMLTTTWKMFLTSSNGQNTAKPFLIVLGGNPHSVLSCDDISSEYPLIPVKLFYICLYLQSRFTLIFLQAIVWQTSLALMWLAVTMNRIYLYILHFFNVQWLYAVLI